MSQRQPADLAMPERPLVSPFIAGDPVRLGIEATSDAQITTALALPAPSGVIDLVPGVALAVVPAPPGERLSGWWVQLPHGPTLRSSGPPDRGLPQPSRRLEAYRSHRTFVRFLVRPDVE